MESFSERLKELMSEKETTPKELGNAINVDSDSVYLWLANTGIPKLQNLISLANYFSCSIDYLVGRTNNFSANNYKECEPFNIRLQFLMEKDNSTLSKICREKNIPKYAFSNWRSGKHLPLLDNLIKLAEYFDCTIDYLVGRES